MGKNEDIDAEIARLGALSLDQLGQDVLRRAWGPDGPAAKKGEAELHEITKGLDPTGGSRFDVGAPRRGHRTGRVPADAPRPRGAGAPGVTLTEEAARLDDVVLEGLHALERAGLLVPELDNGRGHLDTLHWKLTRTGRAALADGSVAQRIP